MVVKNLKLVNYRNYDNLNIDLGDKLNIFIGDNAQGKTNILESIYTLALTKSFLNVKDKNLIKDSCIFAKISAIISDTKNNEKFEIIINDGSKKAKINGNEIKKYSDYISRVRVLIFGPNSISLIKESPGNRRKFLNVEISQLSNKYVKLLQNYNIILKQRNELLKIFNNSKKINKNYLDVINEKFSTLAVEIVIERINFIEKINAGISNIYKEITDYDELNVKYISNVIILKDKNEMKKTLIDKLKSVLEKEINYGITLLGPHRDDFSLVLGNKDLSIFGSQGQYRAAVLALKLSEIDIFKEITGDYPVLLLDDIFSEFDLKRKNKIIKYILKDIQTIITTTDLNLIDDVLLEKAKIFNINSGKIVVGNEEEGMEE